MSTGTPDLPVHDGPRSGAPLLERGDAELLAASRTGDKEAYGELFRRHAPAATALARRLTGHPSDADDLVSEAFTKVLAALRNGNGPTSALRPYLLTAVRRVHVDRAVAAQKVQPTDDIGAHDPGVPFVDPALAGLERSMVAQAYQQLPERWQMVLWHTEVEELSPKDIAPLLGMSANAVAALALRARAGLREAYLAAHVTNTSSPECERMLPKLAAYVRGSAAARERAAVERHLPGCEDCRAVLAELQDVGGRMRSVIGPLILGGAATGYLADVALLPAIGTPAALAATAAAGGSAAGGSAAGGSTSGATAVGNSAGGGAAGGSSGGMAGAGMAGVGGWVVGGAAALIVVGAVAGAVMLSQGDTTGTSDTARNGSSSSAPVDGVPGAGAAQPPASDVPAIQPPPPNQPTNSTNVQGPQAATATNPPLPIGNRTNPAAATAPSAPTTPTPTAPTAVPTTPPTTSAPVPAPITPTTPPVVTPAPVPTTPAVAPTQPAAPPTQAPPAQAPDAPAVTVAADAALTGGSTDSGLALTFPQPTTQDFTVTVTLPESLTATAGADCLPTTTGAVCTVSAGSTGVRVPVQVATLAQPRQETISVVVSGVGVSEKTSSVTVSLTAAPAAPTVSLSDTPVIKGGADAALTLTFDAPTTKPLTIELTLPAPLTLRPGSACTATTDGVSCPVPVGAKSISVPVAVGAVDAARDLPVTGQVTGAGLLPTPVAGSVKVTPATVNGALSLVNSWTGSVSSQTIGGSWLRSGNQGASADLTLTGPVKFARLYWAGQNDRGPVAESMQLTAPDGTTHTVVANRTSDLPAAGAQGRSFVSSADVTSLITADGKWTGDATNPLTGNGNGDFSGWMLIVVQEDPSVVNDTVTLLDGGVVVAPQTGYTSYSSEAAMGARTATLLAFGAGNGSGDSVSVGNKVVVSNGFRGQGLNGSQRGLNLVTVPVAGAVQPLRVDAGNETFSLTAMIVTKTPPIIGRP